MTWLTILGRLGLAAALLLAPFLDLGPADEALREPLARLAQDQTRGPVAPVTLRSPRAASVGIGTARSTRLLHGPLGGPVAAGAVPETLADEGACVPRAEESDRAPLVRSLPPRAPPLPARLLA